MVKILKNDENTHAKMIEDMESFSNAEFSPYVGTFWYDPSSRQLFGVNKVESDCLAFSANGLKTTPRLHKHIWAKEYNKCKQRGNPSFFSQPNYTAVPRGRVFQISDGTFEVMVGSWIQGNLEVKSIVLAEFDLPPDHTKFVRDSHWDVGCGWDGDK